MKEITQNTVPEIAPEQQDKRGFYGNEPINALEIREFSQIRNVLEDVNKIKFGTTSAMNSTSLTVTEPDCTTSSVIMWTALSAPVGFIEVSPGTGQFTITSTATESGLTFSYVVIH